MDKTTPRRPVGSEPPGGQFRRTGLAPDPAEDFILQNALRARPPAATSPWVTALAGAILDGGPKRDARTLVRRAKNKAARAARKRNRRR